MSVTEPTATKYWTYYAALASWSTEVDSVFVVDGHSDEDLLKKPQEIFGPMENITVVREPETFWGSDDNWIVSQAGVNWNIGVECASLDHDLIFVVGADQVAYPGIRKAIDDKNLIIPESGGWYEFWRSRYRYGSYNRRADKRGIVIAPPKDSISSPLVIGNDMKLNTLGDFPLRATHKSAFLDPFNGIETPVMGGSKEEPLGILDAECGSFGHFWYTMQECQTKIQRWDRATSRYAGVAFRHPRELYLLNGLYTHSADADSSTWDDPGLPELFQELLQRFFEPGMIGGSPHAEGFRARIARIERKFWGVSRRLRTKLARKRGLVGLKDMLEWKALGSEEPEPTDISEAFRRQNMILN